MNSLTTKEIQNLQALLCSANENSVLLGLELLKQHEEEVETVVRPLLLLYYFQKPQNIVSVAKYFLEKHVFHRTTWRAELYQEIIVLIRMGGNANYYNYFYKYKYWEEKTEMLEEMQAHLQHFETYVKLLQSRAQFYGRLYLNIADHLKHHQYYSLALTYYSYAQQINPNLGEAYFYYAQILQTKFIQKGKRQEDYKQVVQNYQKAFEFNPQQLNCYMNTAILYEELGYTQKAIEHYKKLLKIKADHIGSLNNLANIYIEAKDFEKAKRYISKAHNINPKDVHVLDSYAHILMLGFQDFVAAKDFFEEVIQLDEDHHYSFTGLGDWYQQQGNYDLADQYYRRGIKKGGLYTTKEVEELLEKFEKIAAFYFYNYNESKLAKKYCKKMLKLRPKHTFALKLLQQIINQQ